MRPRAADARPRRPQRETFQGTGVSRGSALGRARVRLPHVLQITEQRITRAEVAGELKRLHAALAVARGEMQALREQLQGALAHEVGEFLDLHSLLLDDPELLRGLDGLIRDGHYSADYALRLQRDRIASVFAGMDDAYLRSRIDDIDQVIGRIHAALHRREAEHRGAAGEILLSDDIAPTELAPLQSHGVVAIVTTGGSSMSHAAILARSLHLPLVVGAAGALARINDGDVLVVDGDSGLVVLEPGPADLRAHRERQRALAREHRALSRFRDVPTRTIDGVSIQLQANAESAEDVAAAHAMGAAGIGLYRSEFLFLGGRDTLPDEEEQFSAYRAAVLGMAGQPVTIRTMDLGTDKADRTGLVVRNEANPALGLRGIRLSLRHPALLLAQLRAILRASGYGPVRVLLPMISGREEVLAVRGLLAQAAAGLHAEGIETATSVPLGAMIEVPAAAFALGDFIDAVDFLSIGTNDLVQYLLAADRGNPQVAGLYSPLHPAVLRLLHDVVVTCKAHARPLAVCGEMAGDPQLAPLLLALGITELGMHPSRLLEMRRAIGELDMSRLQARAAALRRCNTRAAIEQWLDSEPGRVPAEVDL